MGKFIDLTGQKFGRLTVIKRVENRNKQTAWLCKCDCGNEAIVIGGMLKNGNTKSCGCYKRDRTIEFNQNTKKQYNTYDLSGEYGVGYTNKGEEFYFDLEDYIKIKDYCWYLDKLKYVKSKKDVNNKEILFHRLIKDLDDSKIYIDHINRIPNDNRKVNLRIVTYSQNCRNRVIQKNNSSGFIGVSKYVNRNKFYGWIAYITVEGSRVNLGIFATIKDALIVRLRAELEYFGAEFSPQRHLFEEYGIKNEIKMITGETLNEWKLQDTK